MKLNSKFKQEDTISSTFKAEYSNLVAILCQFYGIENIQLAEDIISDTFLQAMKSWSHNGIPEKQTAWLRRVAINKAKDHFRKNKVFKEKVLPNILANDQFVDQQVFTKEIITDSQLNMLFAVCHPNLKIDAQICLALRYLCGFNIGEIAVALLSNKEAINKKLYRAKKKLKTHKESWKTLKPSDYPNRLDNVLRIIYLLFNEGYYSSISELGIRNEICWEAMRLGIFLSNQDNLPKSNIYALIALMCFHASRFNSRINSKGEYILYDDQDRKLWDQNLIQKGEMYLSLSSSKNNLSKYHLEAAIAFWHTNDFPEKWNHILQLYNKLLTLEYSPTTAMNRTYALALANSVDEALVAAKKLNLTNNHLYYCLIAELYKMSGEFNSELKYLNLALENTHKRNEKAIIKKKIARNIEKN